MYRPRIVFVSWLLCAAPFVSASARGQDKCPPPPTLTASGAPNNFTPEQEVELGQIEAERVERTARVIHDDALAARMNGVVNRILEQLPPTRMQFHATLIDEPVVNAFTLPGGRIYVTRKMIAFIRNDDELADLLGHEMGHALSHQGAIDMTRDLRDVLGVTSVGDRKDLFDKFNRLMDNVARDPKVLQQAMREEEPQQYQADIVALFALGNAGYAPQTFANFFDRLAQTKGNTGNWMTDFFGATTPNQKRLREIRKNIDELPAACRGTPSPEPTEDFLAWQSDVISYSGLGRKEVLSGVLDKKTLDPPLRNDITNLRFSPDGRYILAQDDASVFVLSRDPLRLLFRADAPESHAAQFTPDSKSVVFDTKGMRVEEWNIDDGEREGIHDLAIPGGCVQTLLSPDGKTLACINNEFDVSLYDVAQGDSIFTKKRFFAPNMRDSFAFFWMFLASLGEHVEFQWVRMGFSPDGASFIGTDPSNSLAVSITNHEQISLHGALPDMVRGGFTFIAPDRVVAINREDIKKSAVLSFPSGDVINRFPLGGDYWSAASHGKYLIVGPLKDFPVGVLDLSSNKFVFGSKDVTAVDAFENLIAAQTRNGEIGLLNLDTSKVDAHTEISLSPLGTLRAAAVSPDLKWVGFSGNTRGAVWDVATAKRRFYTRSFHGAYFDGDAALFADFPKRDLEARSIARLDLAAGAIKPAVPVEEKSAVRQWGQFLVNRKPLNGDHGVVVEVSQVEDGKQLWTRAFPKGAPSLSLNTRASTMLLGWYASQDGAKDEIKNDPEIQTRLAALHDHASAYLLEVLDASTGAKKGAVVVDTGKGSFLLERGYAVGDWVVIVDSDSRTRVYSLSTGEQKGVVFGTQSILSPAAGILSIENEPGRVDVYSLPSFEKRGELLFSSPVALWSFSDDGKRLFILTKNQVAYTFDTSRIAMPDTTPLVSADQSKP